MPRASKPNSPEGTVWFGGDVERASVCLRFLGDDLNPLDITAALGVEPTRSGQKGDPVLRPNGEISRHRRTGFWLLQPDLDLNATVAEAIVLLLNILPQDIVAWNSLTDRFQADLICHLTVRGANQGFVLPPEVVQRISRLGISAGFDIFTKREDDQAEG
jgi:Domain of unknown function (DUF4279)